MTYIREFRIGNGEQADCMVQSTDESATPI
jgi:hypothetical protein